MTLTPAYGRDYKTAKAAKAAFNSDADWIVNDMSSRWDGKPINRSDLAGETVTLRFCQLRKVTTVKVPF